MYKVCIKSMYDDIILHTPISHYVPNIQLDHIMVILSRVVHTCDNIILQSPIRVYIINGALTMWYDPP